MAIRVLAVGKKHEPWVSEGITRYERRLKRPFTITWRLLPHSHREGEAAREEESKRILSNIAPSDTVVLLDERGTLFTSPALQEVLRARLDGGEKLTLVIGGAYGVNDAVRARAQVTWSLSPLVFPHQLVRLLVAEQLYRAQTIGEGGHYHHV